jgi:ribosomal protein S18 acetylase RimI-like enzyme
MLEVQNLTDQVRPQIAVMNITLRNLQTKDYPRLEGLLARIPSFSQEDKTLAMELINAALSQPGQKDYLFLIAANGEDDPLGYVCFGPSPLTVGTFDLYWIVVDPGFAGQRIGTMLLKAVEEEIRKSKGRMLIIETSSGPAYESTRLFYLKNHYRLVETIPDFFREGEDRVTYMKKFL